MKKYFALITVLCFYTCTQSIGSPNFLFVLLDDFGVGQFAPYVKDLSEDEISEEHKNYVGSLGENTYDASTALEFCQKAMPTLDQLAKTGVIFTHAYSSSNLCAPARTGILTGLNHIRWGAYRNMDINICGLPEDSVLTQKLQQSGYETGFIGKWHVAGKDQSLKKHAFKQLGIPTNSKLTPKNRSALKEIGYFGSVDQASHPLNVGFDYYFGYNKWECPFYDSELIWENHTYTGKQTQYNTDLFTDKTIEFIKQSIDKQKPFFVELSLHAMHSPLEPWAPEKYRKPFNSGNEYLDKYYAHLHAVDSNIERILNYLRERGVDKNTIIIFSSDNGATCTERSVLPGNAPHRGYKGTYFQGGFQVPLLIHFPQQFQKGKHLPQLVSSMDIYPTALDLAGLKIPQDIDGKSLRPLLNGKSQTSPHGHMFWAGIHSRAWGFDRSKTPGGLHDFWRDRSPASWVIIDDPYLLRYISPLPSILHPDVPNGVPASLEMYDIRQDPMERKNIISQHPERAKSMQKAYWNFAKDLPEPHYQVWEENNWSKLLIQ